MTKLSFIANEARRHLKSFARHELEDLQGVLVGLGQKHWRAIRGPKPGAGLACAIWTIQPHLSDLIVDSFGASEERFSEEISYLPLVKVFAVLVMNEIESGDAEGARLAYEAMMLSETQQAWKIYIKKVGARLRGGRIDLGRWHKHGHLDHLFRAVALIAEFTGRLDYGAMVAAIDYIAVQQVSPEIGERDTETKKILEFLQNMGLVFDGFTKGRVYVSMRGMTKKPVSQKRLQDILAQIRAAT